MLKRAATYTLGCKVNQIDTEAIESMLQDGGYEIVDFNEIADVYVINTCTVTSSADKKSRQIIRRARNLGTSKDSVVVVTGCYAQSSPEDILEKLDVDLVIGNTQRLNFMKHLQQYLKDGVRRIYVEDILKEKEFEELKIKRAHKRTRAFVKIQEGCQQFCSYCIIPYTRGPLRSKAPENVIKEIIELEKNGFREAVLTGIHIGSYGKDFDQDYSLTKIIRKIIANTKTINLRISSIEPMEVSEELAMLIAEESRLCDHLHIPLQSGDDFILRKMNRPYDTAFFAEKIRMVRKHNPEISITTDIMTGFPYEEEKNAENTLKFAEEMQFSDIHVFKYSPRHNTPASKYPNQVAPSDKEKRSHELLDLARDLKKNYYQKFLGKDVMVILEQKSGSDWEGHTSNYLKVLVSGEGEKNQLRQVRLERIEGDAVIGNFL